MRFFILNWFGQKNPSEPLNNHLKCSGLVSQCCDVVLVRAHLARENPRGVGISEWEEWGGMEVGRSVYKQPGTRVDGILSQQGGLKVSKGDQKRESKKAKGIAP
jgi:hypothetical protein